MKLLTKQDCLVRYLQMKHHNIHEESWWKCKNNHVFKSKYAYVSQDCWCRECAGTKPKNINDYICLAVEKNLEYLGMKEEKKYCLKIPKTIMIKSWWKCKNKHIFESRYNSLQQNQGCPFCLNKTESILYDFLKEKYSTSKIIYQYKVKWCKNIKCLPYDFMILNGDFKIILELDGNQHVYQVQNWDPPEMARQKDIYKMKQAIDNDHYIIRIRQQDIINNIPSKDEWINNLINSIEKIHSETQNIKEPIYLSHDSKFYDKHSEDFTIEMSKNLTTI